MQEQLPAISYFGGSAPKPPRYFLKGNVWYASMAVQAEEPMAARYFPGNAAAESALEFPFCRSLQFQRFEAIRAHIHQVRM